jgi:hypothetical protein
MNNMINIKIGFGLNNLKFGFSQKEVKLYLGEPEEISEEGEQGELEIAWYYWKEGLSVHFDEEDNFKLGGIETSNKSSSLNGFKMIGLHIDELLPIIQNMELGNSNIDSNFLILDDLASTEISYEESSLIFWLENDILTEIQWGYIIDSQDQIIWP